MHSLVRLIRCVRRSVGLGIVLVVAGGLPRAQVAWERVPQPGCSVGGMAFDPARQEIVMFGGWGDGSATDETWVWSASNGWTRLSPAVRPSRGGRMMTMASNRVLLVGYSASGLIETWEWDGGARTWTRHLPPASPLAGESWDVTWDSVRGRAVLVQGTWRPGPPVQTWEWDGSTWTQVASPVAPDYRAGYTLGYDPVRQRTVLHGGSAYRPGWGEVMLNETWLWDGTTWVQAAAGGTRTGHTLCFDTVRGRLVGFGGWDGSEQDGESFEWDGTRWTSPSLGPLLGRSGHGMVFDGQQIVVFGGSRVYGYGTLSDMWRYDGSVWTEVVDPTRPGARRGHAAAYDSLRQRHVVFGGRAQSWRMLDDTWLLVGPLWLPTASLVAPPARFGHGMVYDSRRDRVVLFGGATAPRTEVGDTWEWDGSQWLARMPPASPPARLGHGMAFDSQRGVVVLFGGSQTANGVEVPFRDTWEWNGTSWQQRAPTTAPPPMAAPALAYDRARQRTVLLGGSGTSGWETWEFDGANWTRRLPTAQPAAWDFDLAYDLARQRTVAVVQGGREIWEWDGADWTQRPPLHWYGCRAQFTMAYDEWRGKVVLFGGECGFVVLDGLWEYGPTHPASVTSFGLGCAGSAGTPTLAADSLPWLGDTFRLQGTALPTNGLGAFLFLGVSRTSFGGVPLPLDLMALRMPGCFLQVSIDVAVFAPVVNGTASWSLPICACPELLGASAFTQFTAIDAAANPGGLSWSRGTENRIGGR